LPEAGHHEQSDHDKHGAAHDVHDADVAFQPGDGSAHPAESERDQQERDPEPEAVHGAEQRTARRGAAVEAQRENRGQRRPDARGPAEAEHEAEERGTGETGGDAPARSGRALQERELADEHEAHDDHDHPGDARDDVHPLFEQEPCDTEHEAERHEDDAESEHEQGDPEQESPAVARLRRPLTVASGEPADESEVAGNEGEDARGGERDDAGQEGDRDRDEEAPAQDEFTDRVHF